MRATAPFRPNPRGRRKSPLAALLGIGALAALAIAPAHAMAVAESPSAGECRGETVTWNGIQFCAANQGSGGNAGTGTGALPGGRQPGEVVWVTGEIPVCLRNPSRCFSHQFGGRGGRQEIDGDRPGSSGPRGGAGKGSAGSGKQTEMPGPSKGLCAKYRDDAAKGVLAPALRPRLTEIRAREMALEKALPVKRFLAVRAEAEALFKEIERLAAEADKNAKTITGLLQRIEGKEQRMTEIRTANPVLFKELDALRGEEVGMLRKNAEAWRSLLAECQKRYGP